MLKTKEFADLCGTTKETLFHYDRIGLLKPAQVSSNGYRLWSPNQRAKFFLVSLLKDSGCSLKEIDKMCGSGSEAQTLTWLKQRKKQMKKQIATLKNGYSQLSDLINGLETLSAVSWGELHFEKCPADKFRLVPIPPDSADLTFPDATQIEALTAGKKKFDPTIRPIGRLLDRKAAETGIIHAAGFLFTAKSGKAGAALKMKSGKYGIWYIKGLPEFHASEIQKKMAEIKSAGFKCASDIYAFDQPDLSLNNTTEELTVKYMVLVE